MNKNKILSLLYSVALLFSFLVPITAKADLPAANRGDYNWVSSTKITSSSLNETFTVGGEQSYKDFGNEINSQTHYILISSKTYPITVRQAGTIYYPYILSVSKADPTSGELKKQTGTTQLDTSSVKIYNPSGAAPAPKKLITKGQIVGKVFKGDGWPEAASFNTNIDNRAMGLYTDEGTKIAFDGGGDERRIHEEGGKYYYSQFSINKVSNLGGLYEGRYRIKYFKEEGASCTDGNPQGGTDLSQLACKSQIKGILNFDLVATSNGEGKIVLVGNSEEEMDSPGNGKLLSDLTKDKGVNVQMDFNLTSPLDDALTKMMGWAADIIEWAIQTTMGWVIKLLDYSEDAVLGNPGIEGAWVTMRNIGISLLVLALMIIAFANVLQINIEQYGLNRIIPKIIISIVMAYFSWLIVAFMFDFTRMIETQAYGLMTAGNGLEVFKSLSIEHPSGSDFLAKLGSFVLMIAIFIGVLVCAVILLFSLVLRIVYLSFLLAVAPLAFILNIMPFTADLYKQWWNQFWKWMFMAPVALIIIALGTIIASGGGGLQTSYKADNFDGSGFKIFLNLVIFAASIYMAATVPLKWGGSIMGAWQKAGKNLWGKTGGAAIKAGWKATGVPDATKTFMDKRTAAISQRRKQRGERLYGQMAAGNHSFITGAKGNQIQAEQQKLIKAEQEFLQGKTADDLNKMLLTSQNPYQQQAIISQLGKNINLGKEKPEDKIRTELFKKFVHDNGDIQAQFFKDAPEALLQYSDDKDLEKNSLKALTGKNLPDLSSKQISAMTEAAKGEHGDDAKKVALEYFKNLTDKQVETASQYKDADAVRALEEGRRIAQGPVSTPPGSNWSDENHTRFDG